MLRSKLEEGDGIVNSPYLCSCFTKAVSCQAEGTGGVWPNLEVGFWIWMTHKRLHNLLTLYASEDDD